MPQRRTPSGQGPGRSRGGRSKVPSPGRDASRESAPSTRTPGRSAARPAARRTAARRAGGAKRTPAPKPKGRFTGRAAILALVLSALVLAYAYPVRTYLAQRSEIDRLSESQRAQEKRIADLEKELDKWDDPEYVRAQARSRLHYIRPDEVPYVVIESEEDSAGDAGDDARGRRNGSWHDRMWGSVAATDGAGG